jgi:hypothetical protein
VSLADLLQRLRSRDRDHSLLAQGRSHDLRRELTVDAPPFYPIKQGNETEAHSQVTSSPDPLHHQRRQLGERLYVRVAAIQPVSRNILLYAAQFLSFFFNEMQVCYWRMFFLAQVSI